MNHSDSLYIQTAKRVIKMVKDICIFETFPNFHENATPLMIKGVG